MLLVTLSLVTFNQWIGWALCLLAFFSMFWFRSFGALDYFFTRRRLTMTLDPDCFWPWFVFLYGHRRSDFFGPELLWGKRSLSTLLSGSSDCCLCILDYSSPYFLTGSCQVFWRPFCILGQSHLGNCCCFHCLHWWLGACFESSFSPFFRKAFSAVIVLLIMNFLINYSIMGFLSWVKKGVGCIRYFLPC